MSGLWFGIYCWGLLGEIKPSVDGKKEGIKIRHGDHESVAGIECSNTGDIIGRISFYVLLSN